MTNQSFDNIQELDALIASQQWNEAFPLAQELMHKIPLTPGVLERLLQVLRVLRDWEALTDVLMRARNGCWTWGRAAARLRWPASPNDLTLC